MNQKRRVAPKTPQAQRLESITTTVNGGNRTLTVGRELSLHLRPTIKPGRYRLDTIEVQTDGESVLLSVYGPLGRNCAKMRYVRPTDVKAIHVKPRMPRVQADDEQ